MGLMSRACRKDEAGSDTEAVAEDQPLRGSRAARSPIKTRRCWTGRKFDSTPLRLALLALVTLAYYALFHQSNPTDSGLSDAELLAAYGSATPAPSTVTCSHFVPSSVFAPPPSPSSASSAAHSVLTAPHSYLDWRLRACLFEDVLVAADGSVILFTRPAQPIHIAWKLVVQHGTAEVSYSAQQLCAEPGAASMYAQLSSDAEQRPPTRAHLDMCEHIRERLPNAFLPDGSLVTFPPSPESADSSTADAAADWHLPEDGTLVNAHAGEPAEEAHVPIAFRVVQLPAAAAANEDASLQPVAPVLNSTAVLLSDNYPANVGHYLMDDIFASFVAVNQLDAAHLRAPVQLLRMRSCGAFFVSTWRRPRQSEERKCVRLHQQWTPIMLDTRSVSLPEEGGRFSPAEEDCSDSTDPACVSAAVAGASALWVSRLVVGVSMTSVRRFDHAAARWLQFRSRVVDALNLTSLDGDASSISSDLGTTSLSNALTPPASAPAASHPTRITIFDKRGTAKDGPPVRAITNAAELSAALQQLPSVSVVLVDPSALDLRAQLELLLRTDVLLTPCGGISLMLGFLRPGSVVAVFDYWDPAIGSVGMEDTMWRPMSHLHRVFYPADVESLVPAHPTGRQVKLAMGESRAEYFRQGFNLRINTTRFVRLIEPSLERQRACANTTAASCVTSFWPPAEARPVDWRVCGQLGDGDEGSYVSEGICLPYPALSHRLQHASTMMKLALRSPPDVQAEMRACESADVRRELMCRQSIATEKPV